MKRSIPSSFGVIGLGVMGKALSLNLLDQNVRLSVFNRDEGTEKGIVSTFLDEEKERTHLLGFTALPAFIQSLEAPRKIFLMIKAGTAVDGLLDTLLPLLDEGDIIMDGGNSHYKDTQNRFKLCKNNGIEFLGIGVSGGEQGARFGPSIMPGGSKNAFQQVSGFLNDIAAKDSANTPCCAYIGPDGAGHFVKMVHNGIEYAEMQLLAETYHLLRTEYSDSEIAELFQSWTNTQQNSYLLEITAQILQKKENNRSLLSMILDKAGNKGTGSWSSIAALELGSTNSMMSSAVFARYVSSRKKERQVLSQQIAPPTKTFSIQKDTLFTAYSFARVINHIQGFELLQLASVDFDWNLQLHEIARIWTNGCIIRSTLMEQFAKDLKSNPHLLNMQQVFAMLTDNESSLQTTLTTAISKRIPTPCYSAALSFWIAITTEQLPANLLQAQRDFFGAHTYQRIDDPDGNFYHTNWEG